MNASGDSFTDGTDMSERAIWCELAWLPDTDVATEGVVLRLVEGRIKSIEVGVAAGDLASDVEILHGLTFPGFANSHSHAFHRALRGRTHGGTGDFWTWRDQMYAIAARLEPENYYELAVGVFGEMLEAGMTCVGEFHYVHHQPDGTPYVDANAMGNALVAAADTVGIRITLLDTCYLQGGLSADGVALPLNATQQRFSDGSVEAWLKRWGSARTESNGSRIGAAIHSVRAVDVQSIGFVAAFANERTLPLHAHVSEQPAENEQCQRAYGMSPIEVLQSAGALTERFTAVHATHLTGHDIQALGSARCSCCFCPTTERDLADGIGPSTGLANAGATLTLGSDQHAVIDPFEEMRALELNERLSTLQRGNHRVADILRAATQSGYTSLGWEDGGSISVGALADLTTINLSSRRLAGTDVANAIGAAVFGASADDVDNVIVAGRTVVANGRHIRISVAEQLDRSIRALTSDTLPLDTGVTSEGLGQ